ALPPDSARMRAIYPVVRQHDLLVYVHLGEGQQTSFERALSENPDINFIFHGDQLIVYGQNGRQDLSALDEILTRHPNAFYGIDELYGDTWLLRPDVSKEKFFAHFKNYRELLQKDTATWKAFIERHPRQVLWGTDRGAIARWTMDPDVGIYLTRYARAFIALLDPAVQDLFAHENAERLLLEK
ncbi:MAG TPA: amidohydrolase family protein, partial [Candidatus Paceibacterota bacterium]